MREVLYLIHRIPYPPNKGDKIRSYHWLRYLAEHYRVHLGTFIDQPEDWAHLDKLSEWCDRVCAVPLRSGPAFIRSLGHLLTTQPISTAYYRSAVMHRFVESVLRERDIELVVAFSSTMAQYVPRDRCAGVRRVMDFVDVDSDKWRQYSIQRRWPIRSIYRREGVRLGEEERRIANDFDASIFTSAAEIDLFARLAPETADKVHCVRNGVDIRYFDPALDHVNPYPQNAEPIVFTGSMSYWPNVDAVTWFATGILPGVRARRPNAEFFIVGAHPNKGVLKLQDLPGVRVTGWVPDVRPYLAHAKLAVAPMRLARGLQNKVLEALAMNVRVLLTRAATIGIGHHDEHAEQTGITIAEPEGMVEAACTLLDRRPGQPTPCRDFVLRHFQWQPAFDDFGRVLEPARRDPRRDPRLDPRLDGA